jgi:hypothetical protein
MNLWTFVMVVVLVIAAIMLTSGREWIDERLNDLRWFLWQFRIAHPGLGTHRGSSRALAPSGHSAESPGRVGPLDRGAVAR